MDVGAGGALGAGVGADRPAGAGASHVRGISPGGGKSVDPDPVPKALDGPCALRQRPHGEADAGGLPQLFLPPAGGGGEGGERFFSVLLASIWEGGGCTKGRLFLVQGIGPVLWHR